MAREIEVKFKVAEDQKEGILQWIDENAILQRETHQVEYYFDNPKTTFIFQNKDGFKDSEHYLRVRFDKEKGESVCLKIFEQEGFVSRNLDEIEFNVSSGAEAVRLFEALGYTYKIEIDKKRKYYKTSDSKFEICFDDVKGLGLFVEVELLEQIEGDIKVGLALIWNFLRSLGIDEIDEQARGYVSMLWNPEIDFGRKKKLG